jgi:hypothetical protein
MAQRTSLLSSSTLPGSEVNSYTANRNMVIFHGISGLEAASALQQDRMRWEQERMQWEKKKSRVDKTKQKKRMLGDTKRW